MGRVPLSEGNGGPGIRLLIASLVIVAVAGTGWWLWGRQAQPADETAGTVLRTTGKVLRPIGVAMDVYAIGSAFHEDGNRVGVNTGRAISTTVGGLAGAAGGAAAGAAIGSVVPVVGTAVGAVVGGIVGGLGGGELASRGFDWVRSWF